MVLPVGVGRMVLLTPIVMAAVVVMPARMVVRGFAPGDLSLQQPCSDVARHGSEERCGVSVGRFRALRRSVLVPRFLRFVVEWLLRFIVPEVAHGMNTCRIECP